MNVQQLVVYEDLIQLSSLFNNIMLKIFPLSLIVTSVPDNITRSHKNKPWQKEWNPRSNPQK